MTGRIIKKWMGLLLAVIMLISMASLNVSASETDKTYQAYDVSQNRKVISKNGTTDSEWSLCMDHHKQSPGKSGEATGEYSKNENATKDTYASNGGKGDFQKIKRMLFYKLKHPELNYQVLQNEYYYQQNNKTNKSYDTNYSQNPQLNKQKQELRTFAEDSSHDDEINSKMEVFIYNAKKQLMQNLISAKLKEAPKTKVNFSKKALTENGEELAGATIKLTKEDGSIVKEWITDGSVTEFELEDGIYTFTEVSAPDKYQVATAITFEVKDGKVNVKGTEVSGNTLVMVDKLKEVAKTKVNFSKKALTENGEELAGATIKLTKEDGSIVKEWITDGSVTEFELEDGIYTFTEVSAPDKYQVATAITFEVKDGKAIVKDVEVKGNTIVMVDKLKEVPTPLSTKVKFSKKALTENGEELAGATIKLTKEDGSLVKEWLTDGTVTEFELKDGKYTFTETSAPAKYQVATAITFEVKNGKAIVKDVEVKGNTIVMVDKLKEVPTPNTNTNKTLPKTGEGTNISLYAWIMLTSGALLVLIGYRYRNHAK